MRYILWSGGWDSTYMLCKLARESDETIQPVYISYSSGFYKHGNEAAERKARAELLNLIREKTDIKAKIQEPIEIREDALPDTDEYETAYSECKSAIEALYGEKNLFYYFGKASLIFPDIAVGMEAPPPGTRENDVGRFSKLLQDNGLRVDDDGNVNGDNATKAFQIVLGNMRYPLLKINEIQMISDVKEWGYFDDVFQKTWSCYSGMERQCGVCRSCEVKWMSGDAFEWRFDDKAKKDHEIKQYLTSIDETNGTSYANYFVKYILNGNWVTVNDGTSAMSEDSDEYKQMQQKSENLMQYFSYLENKWPEAKDINAPTI